MTDLWLAGAERHPASYGTPPITPRVVVAHTSESAPGSLDGFAGWCDASTFWSHFGVDIKARRIMQFFPCNVAARALLHPAGTPDTNNAGAVQFEIIGHAATIDTDFTAADWAWFHDAFLAPLSTLIGVGLFTPYPFVAYPASYGVNAAQRLTWAQWATIRGLVGHQHVPGNDHGDPGALPVNSIFVPAQTPQPSEQTFQESDVKTALVPLTHVGYGLYRGTYDPALGRDPIIVGAVHHGPFPDVDGWWLDQSIEAIGAQVRAGKVELTARARPDNTAPALTHAFVSVA